VSSGCSGNTCTSDCEGSGGCYCNTTNTNSNKTDGNDGGDSLGSREKYITDVFNFSIEYPNSTTLYRRDESDHAVITNNLTLIEDNLGVDDFVMYIYFNYPTADGSCRLGIDSPSQINFGSRIGYHGGLLAEDSVGGFGVTGCVEYGQHDIRVRIKGGDKDLTLVNSILDSWIFYGLSSDNKAFTHLNPNYLLIIPTGWNYLSRDEQGNPNPAMFYDQRAIDNPTEGDLLKGSKVEIYSEADSHSSVEEAVKSKDTDSQILTETQITIDSVPAVQRTLISSYGGTYINIAYVLRGGTLFGIVQYIPEDSYQATYTEDFEKFLSGFTFAD